MFLGKEGSGALAMALAFAQYIVCEKVNGKNTAPIAEPSLFGEPDPASSIQHPVSSNDSCGECPACIKAAQLIHPDIHFSYPVVTKKTGEKPISTDFIKEWREFILQNAYANGKRSIEGIPAIIGGIPALLSDPFITSAYSSNTITTIPSLLKQKGYTSTFFHGGTNGTMGFDNFSRSSGFDHYFGRTEYDNDDDFDGSWGIYDEPFLQQAALEIDKMKLPFLAVLFTLSSHHPYKIPDKYVNQFPEGTLPLHQSIAYADFSLKRFFETALKMSWFSNTLFVITADHTSSTELKAKQ